MTVAPASANLGAHSPEVDAAGGEQRDVEALDGLLAEALHCEVRAVRSGALEHAAGRALGGEGDDLAGGEPALAQQAQHQAADLSGGADDGYSIAAAHIVR